MQADALISFSATDVQVSSVSHLQIGQGDAAEPSINFGASIDTDTGFYSSAANTVSIAGGGSVACQFVAGAVRAETGSASAPSVGASSHTTTGLYWATSTLGIAGGGAEAARFLSNNVYLTGAKDNTTGSAANTLIQASDGRIFRSTASARRFKKNIGDAPIDLSRFNELRPRAFTYRKFHHDSDHVFWGFIAEEVESVYPKMVEYDQDGKLDNVRYANLVVVSIEKIKELERRIEVLEAA